MILQSADFQLLTLHGAEFGVGVLWLACFWTAWRERRDQNAGAAILVSAAAFAWLFEEWNLLRLDGRGSYSYNAGFWLFLDRVPLFIVLSWSLILWGAMRLCDDNGCDGSGFFMARVGRAAALAVWLDLGFDATAIRHRFWFWHGVGFDQAWFGVPAGNFWGWLQVALAFAFCTRALQQLWTNKRLQQRRDLQIVAQLLLVPACSFALYATLDAGTNALFKAVRASDAAQLWAFFAAFGVVAVVGVFVPRSETKSLPVALSVARWSRVGYHGFAVLGLLILPAVGLLRVQKWPLLALAIAVWVLDEVYRRQHFSAVRSAVGSAVQAELKRRGAQFGDGG